MACHLVSTKPLSRPMLEFCAFNHWEQTTAKNAYILIQENAFENVVCKTAAILSWPVCVNTLRPRQDGRHFPDDIFKCISLNENVWLSIEISLKFVRKGSINNIPALFQIMADQATSHYLDRWWLDYRRIYASLSLNELTLIRIHHGTRRQHPVTWMFCFINTNTV